MALNEIVVAPWFGRRPPDGVDVAWGARAIFVWFDKFMSGQPMKRYPSIDILWDRQSYKGDVEDVRPICEWFRSAGMTLLLEEVRLEKLMPYEDRVLTAGKDGYVIEACPNRSYGYLYIVVYPSGEVRK